MKIVALVLGLLLAHTTEAITYHLHTVSESASGRIRVANLSSEDTQIQILGFDAVGDQYGPVELALHARAAVVLTAEELKRGTQSKGLPTGLGNGTGAWHLQLESHARLGGLSYLLRNGQTEVLSELEPVFATHHFLRAHQLVDRIETNRLHELLSAYDWVPHMTVDGVDLGWGETESLDGGAAWTRYGGHLLHSAFAVEYRMHAGQQAAHVHSVGVKSNCGRERSSVLDLSTRWRGVAVLASSNGIVGYAPVLAYPTPATGPIYYMENLEFQRAFDAAREALDVRPPYNFLPGSFPGGHHMVGSTRDNWAAYQWNPPQYLAHLPEYASPDPDASPKPTWDQLVDMFNRTDRARLRLEVGRIHSMKTGHPIREGMTLSAKLLSHSPHEVPEPSEKVGFFGPDCAEVGGWIRLILGSGEIEHWVFGATKQP